MGVHLAFRGIRGEESMKAVMTGGIRRHMDGVDEAINACSSSALMLLPPFGEEVEQPRFHLILG